MNYQESLERLEKEKERLEEEVNNSERSVRELNKRKLSLVEDLVKGYAQSSTKEVSSDEVDQVFSKLYGFARQKEEIKELLLAQKYFKAKDIKIPLKGKVLCFVGPPGVGKTAFAELIAEALGRKFHRVNLGGSASAIIITGGKEMWIGAKRGEIINAIAKTQTCNPVVLLDEVEKSAEGGHHGNIEDALLHVLDPEQNQHFKDHFLDIEIDISQITFILTANDVEKISDPLKNRLEIVKLKKYNEEQKMKIGKILIDKIFKKKYDDCNKDLFEMSEEALRALITKVDDSGVRQLEKKIEKTISWCVSQWTRALEKSEQEQKMLIDEEIINEIFSEDSEEKDEEKEKNEETKLREKNEELEKQVKELEKSRSIYSLTKPLEISQDEEDCSKHQKKTLQTANKTCFLCELEEQVEQFIATISKENWKQIDKIWQDRKLEWLKQATDLQSGSDGEREISQQLKSSIKKIDRKIQQVQKIKGGSPTSQQPKKSLEIKDWLLIGGGIIMFFLVGCLVWIFTKKKKKPEAWQRIDHWKPTIPAPPTPRR